MKNLKKKYRSTTEIDNCRSNSMSCNGYAIINKENVDKLYSYIPLNDHNKNEVAGPLKLRDTNKSHNGLKLYEIIIDDRNVKGGDNNEVDAVETKYNFHSHPEAAYIAHNCELGWPSRDDYITFLDGFFKSDTTFHIISTKEGIYILKINPCCIKKLKDFYKALSTEDKEKFIDNVDNWADEFINISKVGLKIKTGVKAPKTGDTIKTPKQYVDFINNVICDKIKLKKDELLCNMPIFDIEYISWKDSTTKPFIFTRLKNTYGKCNMI